jgi:hypothetical protein
VPPQVGWQLSLRLPRDHYVRVDANDYSVHPSVIGRRVEVQANLEEVTARCGERDVARHPRCWASHQTITAADHERAARDLRRRHRAGRPAAAAATEVARRDLADYDRLFGLTDHPDGQGEEVAV